MALDDLAQHVVNNYRKAARRPVEKLAGDFGGPVAVSLPQPKRLMVFRAGVEGFTYREIVDVPLGTVMSRLHRGGRHAESAGRCLPSRKPIFATDPIFPRSPQPSGWGTRLPERLVRSLAATA